MLPGAYVRCDKKGNSKQMGMLTMIFMLFGFDFAELCQEEGIDGRDVGVL